MAGGPLATRKGRGSKLVAPHTQLDSAPQPVRNKKGTNKNGLPNKIEICKNDKNLRLSETMNINKYKYDYKWIGKFL